MRFLADENVKERLVYFLNSLGHDVEGAPKGTRDSALFLLAQRERRTLLTNDTDFLNLAAYPPDGTEGIIILRVFPPTFENQKVALVRVLNKYSPTDFSSKAVEVWKDFEVAAP